MNSPPRRLIGNVALTEKEIRITAMVAEGLKNVEIGRHLGITEHVVKNYLKDVFDRTGQSTRLEVALWYLSKTEGTLRDENFWQAYPNRQPLKLPQQEAVLHERAQY